MELFFQEPVNCFLKIFFQIFQKSEYAKIFFKVHLLE